MPARSKNPKEKFKVKHHVFDEFTNWTLFKLMAERHFKGLESPLSSGKESNIFSAITDDGKRVIIKIYRLETCDFNRMFDYIKDDPRFFKLRRKKRKIIFAWVQREYNNIHKAYAAKVPVPRPIALLNNVIVLEFIGTENEAAPKLKDQIPNDLQAFYGKIIIEMKRLYKAGLVHGDLSSFNILNLNEQPVFIDFSQATTLGHSRAMEYLYRDVHNICEFFTKNGLEKDAKKVFCSITGKKSA